jgi:hypothetical protein
MPLALIVIQNEQKDPVVAGAAEEVEAAAEEAVEILAEPITPKKKIM